MKIFGSDGFRCEFGTKFLSFESITNFAISLGEVYTNKKFDSPIVISRDTRFSGKVLEDIISSILNFKGIDTVSAGVLPTPGLSKILEKNNFSLGIMITASHNPYTDNGIKLLGPDGFKLDRGIESEIEEIMINNSTEKHKASEKIGSNSLIDGAIDTYIEETLSRFSFKDLKSKVLIDCSNGAFSQLNKNPSLSKLKNLYFLSNSPDGYNINLDCGALEAASTLKDIKKNGLDFGVAFDGDGDRAIFISSEYGVIETEKIVCLLFQMFSAKTKNNLIVSSEIVNLSLRHNLLQLGAELIETEVGDRHVIDKVRQDSALFGFEPSGHFFFPESNNSMDGLSSLFYFFELINHFGNSLNQELEKLDHYQRIQKNFEVDQNRDININELLNNLKKLIDPEIEKVVLRRSMWDPVIRIYYDFKEVNNFLKIEKEINLYFQGN